MLTKSQIIQAYESLIPWVKQLEGLSDELWLTPIREGKWTVGEIIAHFIIWDRYVFDERIPLIHPSAELPGGVEANAKNADATNQVKSKSKEAIIQEFIQVRQSGIDTLKTMSDKQFFAEFKISGKSLRLAGYIEGLSKHDEHHKKQIISFLEKR